MNQPRLSRRQKAVLVVRIWYLYLLVRLRLRKGSIVEVVNWLGRNRSTRNQPVSPVRLGRLVARALPVHVSRARCLHKSLVLFGLLPRSEELTELVIGLPEVPETHDAHAWTEVNGVDVGPPPGAGGFAVLARYRAETATSPR